MLPGLKFTQFTHALNPFSGTGEAPSCHTALPWKTKRKRRYSSTSIQLLPDRRFHNPQEPSLRGTLIKLTPCYSVAFENKRKPRYSSTSLLLPLRPFKFTEATPFSGTQESVRVGRSTICLGDARRLRSIEYKDARFLAC